MWIASRDRRSLVCCLCALAVLLPGVISAMEETGEFPLAVRCPPYFEDMPDGTCELRTLYSLYTSPDGFGGLRTPLPEHRGGYTAEQIDLGRYLFFDPALSGDGATSCAHCHHPALGFADGLPRSSGMGGLGVGPARVGGVALPRAAPSLWNAGFLTSFFWDGRSESLEAQARGPLFSPLEMGNSPRQLESELNAIGDYRSLFVRAFGAEADAGVTTELVVRALAAFESSLVSLNSRYDRYAHGDANALTALEQEGHNVFRSFVARCSQCHTAPLFTNEQLAVVGAPEPEGQAFDPGAGPLLKIPQLRGAFKVPTLRNITHTAPYMHSGAFDELAEVVDFYNKGRGHAVPEDEDLLIHWHIVDPDLSATEVAALIAFLGSLNDETASPKIPAAVPSGLPVVEPVVRARVSTHPPNLQLSLEISQ